MFKVLMPTRVQGSAEPERTYSLSRIVDDPRHAPGSRPREREAESSTRNGEAPTKKQEKQQKGRGDAPLEPIPTSPAMSIAFRCCAYGERASIEMGREWKEGERVWVSITRSAGQTAVVRDEETRDERVAKARRGKSGGRCAGSGRASVRIVRQCGSGLNNRDQRHLRATWVFGEQRSIGYRLEYGCAIGNRKIGCSGKKQKQCLARASKPNRDIRLMCQMVSDAMIAPSLDLTQAEPLVHRPFSGNNIALRRWDLRYSRLQTTTAHYVVLRSAEKSGFADGVSEFVLETRPPCSWFERTRPKSTLAFESSTTPSRISSGGKLSLRRTAQNFDIVWGSQAKSALPALGKWVRYDQNLDSKMDILLHERTALHHEITPAAFSSAPVRRVPAGVLVEIFMAVQSMAEIAALSKSADARLGGREIPELLAVGHGPATVISQVSSGWRETACDHPALWSSFSFSPYGTQNTDLAALYLERARSALLTVEMVLSPSSKDQAKADRAIAVLAASSLTLFELRFVTDNEHPAAKYSMGRTTEALPLKPLRGRLPHLEILQIPELLAVTEAFEFVPSLHTLNICAWGYISTFDSEPHPRPKFEQGQICRLTMWGVGASILAYRNVTHLTSREPLSPADPIWTSTPAILPTTLPGLANWTVEFEAPPDLATRNWALPWVFPRFDTPDLRALDILFLHHSGEVIAWVEGARFTLTTLVLRKCAMRVSELLNLLEITPHLEVLTIVDGLSTIVTDRLLQYLTIRPELPDHPQLVLPDLFRLVRVRQWRAGGHA
ncbi:hypothetical protein B0H13DRAFT_1863832 [Mycena leptocephala]|nr:hypothetical protein B0H13DRAFT_1863832 [Mycena leptocephala]